MPGVEDAPRTGRVIRLAIWIATLAVLGWWVERNLVVGSDLRLFMPAPRTAQERLVLEGIGEGPGSRMLLLSVSGPDTQAVARVSQSLVTSLRGTQEFRWLANGSGDLQSIPEEWLPYRFLLSTTFDESALDAAYLQAQLHERLRDLNSPAAGLVEQWLPRDPTFELPGLLESWQSPRPPELLHEVWFDSSGRRALLVAETRAAGFDPQGQRAAALALAGAFKAATTDPAIRLEASGPGAFSTLMQERTQREASRLGTLATLGMVGLLWLAYRSVAVLVLALLPLASAGLAGLAAVSAVFGAVHGITLAFGFTLIGVAQDYPMHLFSHQHHGLDPVDNVRALWPALATGVTSTCVAYLAFLFSGVGGLAQLSVFTVVGLAVAGLTTRYLLPGLVPDRGRDAAESTLLGRVWHLVARLPSPAWLGPALGLTCIAVLWLSPRPVWDDNLGGLTPVPAALIARDTVLRRELGAPDVRYLLVVQGANQQEVLVRLEALEPRLRALADAGALAGYDHAARYLPSLARQEARRAALPSAAELRDTLATVLRSMPFRSGVFEPFVADVERARQLAALAPTDLAGTPLEARVRSLLLERDEGWAGLVTVSDLRTPAALAQLAGSTDGVVLLDLKQASQDLVAHQRTRILWCLAGSAVLLVLVVAVALRERTRIRRVLSPMALTTLVVLAALHLAVGPLNLFHLISLVLAAGLGLDYALFFERAADDPAEQRRTLHAVLVCSASTLMVFALLALSSVPVLRSIGFTVAAGVVCNFVLALVLTRPARSRS